MDKHKTITISICYATSASQDVITMEVPVGYTLKQAVDESGILQRHEEINSMSAMGVFGKVVESTYVLNRHDRIEIYRPLITDPMQARRQRASIQT